MVTSEPELCQCGEPIPLSELNRQRHLSGRRHLHGIQRKKKEKGAVQKNVVQRSNELANVSKGVEAKLALGVREDEEIVIRELPPEEAEEIVEEVGEKEEVP